MQYRVLRIAICVCETVSGPSSPWIFNAMQVAKTLEAVSGPKNSNLSCLCKFGSLQSLETVSGP